MQLRKNWKKSPFRLGVYQASPRMQLRKNWKWQRNDRKAPATLDDATQKELKDFGTPRISKKYPYLMQLRKNWKAVQRYEIFVTAFLGCNSERIESACMRACLSIQRGCLMQLRKKWKCMESASLDICILGRCNSERIESRNPEQLQKSCCWAGIDATQKELKVLKMRALIAAIAMQLRKNWKNVFSTRAANTLSSDATQKELKAPSTLLEAKNAAV